jgi:protein-S-isoprenylcysteine O-methyltransferase Ste14
MDQRTLLAICKANVLLVLWFGIPMFLAAGTVFWYAAWVWVACNWVQTAINFAMLQSRDPELLKERLQPGPAKRWDRRIMGVVGVLAFVGAPVMALDAVRFGWSHMPLWMQMVGFVALLIWIYNVNAVMRANPYLSTNARIQTDRGHQVVTTGPYAIVRHPMYTGMFFFFFGSALLLGSWIGLAFAVVMSALIIARTVLEDRMLRAELVGYEAYCHQVRQRLIPYVW